MSVTHGDLTTQTLGRDNRIDSSKQRKYKIFPVYLTIKQSQIP